MAVAELLKALYGATSESVYLSPAPLYHAAPLRFCMAMHTIGSTVVVMEHFDAEQYLQLVETHRITHSQVVPTMFVRMMKLDPEVRARYDLSSLQCVIHAAAPCPIPVKKGIIEWFGPVIHEYYAGTEGNGFVYCNSEMWLSHEGTVGRPIGCVVHICDDDGRRAADRRERHHLLRGRSLVRVPQRRREDERLAPPARAGARSATSGTSTTTTTST